MSSALHAAPLLALRQDVGCAVQARPAQGWRPVQSGRADVARTHIASRRCAAGAWLALTAACNLLLSMPALAQSSTRSAYDAASVLSNSSESLNALRIDPYCMEALQNLQSGGISVALVQSYAPGPSFNSLYTLVARVYRPTTGDVLRNVALFTATTYSSSYTMSTGGVMGLVPGTSTAYIILQDYAQYNYANIRLYRVPLDGSSLQGQLVATLSDFFNAPSLFTLQSSTTGFLYHSSTTAMRSLSLADGAMTTVATGGSSTQPLALRVVGTQAVLCLPRGAAWVYNIGTGNTTTLATQASLSALSPSMQQVCIIAATAGVANSVDLRYFDGTRYGGLTSILNEPTIVTPTFVLPDNLTCANTLPSVALWMPAGRAACFLATSASSSLNTAYTTALYILDVLNAAPAAQPVYLCRSGTCETGSLVASVKFATSSVLQWSSGQLIPFSSAGGSQYLDTKGVAQACPISWRQDPVGLSCVPCAVGEVLSEGNQCTQCPAGSAGGGLSGVCERCDSYNNYAPTYNHSMCEPCATGRWVNSTYSNDTCVYCPDGSFRSQGMRTCARCNSDAMEVPSAEGETCVPCSAGFFLNSSYSSDHCTRCPYRTFRQLGMPYCQECPADQLCTAGAPAPYVMPPSPFDTLRKEDIWGFTSSSFSTVLNGEDMSKSRAAGYAVVTVLFLLTLGGAAGVLIYFRRKFPTTRWPALQSMLTKWDSFSSGYVLVDPAFSPPDQRKRAVGGGLFVLYGLAVIFTALLLIVTFAADNQDVSQAIVPTPLPTYLFTAGFEYTLFYTASRFDAVVNVSAPTIAGLALPVRSTFAPSPATSSATFSFKAPLTIFLSMPTASGTGVYLTMNVNFNMPVCAQSVYASVTAEYPAVGFSSTIGRTVLPVNGSMSGTATMPPVLVIPSMLLDASKNKAEMGVDVTMGPQIIIPPEFMPGGDHWEEPECSSSFRFDHNLQIEYKSTQYLVVPRQTLGMIFAQVVSIAGIIMTVLTIVATRYYVATRERQFGQSSVNVRALGVIETKVMSPVSRWLKLPEVAVDAAEKSYPSLPETGSSGGAGQDATTVSMPGGEQHASAASSDPTTSVRTYKNGLHGAAGAKSSRPGQALRMYSSLAMASAAMNGTGGSHAAHDAAQEQPGVVQMSRNPLLDARGSGEGAGSAPPPLHATAVSGDAAYPQRSTVRSVIPPTSIEHAE